MSLPRISTREEWRAARVALLADEKAMTRARDALNTKRRELPMVAIDVDYVFEGPQGEVRLADLFEGRRQLIIQHFMSTRRGKTAASAARPPPTRSRTASCTTSRPVTRPWL